MAEERRHYSRVAANLDAWLRRFPDPEGQPALRECALLGDGSVALKNSGLPEALVSFLGAMNDKLDAILSLLSRETLLAPFPFTAEVVEISGGGVKFSSSDRFEVGENLEIALALRKIPFTLVGAVGRVERRDNGPRGEELWSLAFTRLREQDLDEIVRFVLQEERRSIREVLLRAESF